MRSRTKAAAIAVSATLILSASLFNCKPPRTSVLDEGAKDMGKPQVVVPAPVEKKEEADAKTPKERLDSGDTGVVPVVNPRPQFDLPKKKPKPVGRIQ